MKASVFALVFLFLTTLSSLAAVQAGSTATQEVVQIGSARTQWKYVHSTPRASVLVIELGGGRAGFGYGNQTILADIMSDAGVGGLYVGGKIDELILETFTSQFSILVGYPVSADINRWLYAAVQWSWAKGYDAVYGYGFSAGALLWVRYALGDVFGKPLAHDMSVTGIIAKAYPSALCPWCYGRASSFSPAILLIAGQTDTAALLSNAQAFYSRIPNKTGNKLLTYQCNHEELAHISTLPIQQWLLTQL
jgi:hypothetical protein